ncbi:eukaryotic translation initiation factor 5B-like [Chenopodium quinoa]|uniref:eukaryotic translation initiation factor 5B-like n=1 Tax=Chenopodium quinoa TaxID=63459 RepID=UPI000B78253E|nr:eukaryotic translation initiation factor 5B-like [Chenopodium quinoa]XP_021739550.1 eukaryotic translation initiation factor 5B-like [Chenopodium quinoa]
MALSDDELLEKQLTEAGNQLLSPPPSVAELLSSLDRVENLLTRVEQSPSESMKKALSPSMKALIANELLRHKDIDVNVAVASCISEITRITAPDAPYEDDQMKEVFQLIVSSFEKLDDQSSPSYGKRTSILETVAKVRSCVVMLDLECDALIAEMFHHFFRTIRSEHPENVFSSMETIMTLVLEESEDISIDLCSSILDVLKTENKEVLPVARQLGEKVADKCASKLKPYLLPAMKSRGTTLDDYSKIVAKVLQARTEAVEPSEADAAKKNVADEDDLANTPSEKAVEVALETLDDAPPSEEIGPGTVGSPKAVVSNGTIPKEVEDTSAGNDDSKEVNNVAHDVDAEQSKGKVDNSNAEEPTKSRTKPVKVNKRKGKKGNSLKSSSEPAVMDEKEGVETPVPQEKDEMDEDNAQSSAIGADSAKPAENEKEPDAPVPSPKASDEPVDAPSSSPTESVADENPKKDEPGKKKDEMVQSEPAGDVEMKEEESDVKKSSEGLSASESKLPKQTGKKVPSVTDKEDSVLSSDDPKEDEKTSDVEAKPAKQLGKKDEVVGNLRDNKKKRSQGKATPAKELTKTPSKDEKKPVGSAKSTAKTTKDESDVEKASESNSKRKRTNEKKVSAEKKVSSEKKVPFEKKAAKYGKELVGLKVQVWWPDDKKYYKGVIEHFEPASGKHKVLYSDGDVEVLKLEKEKWKLINDDSKPDQGDSSDGEIPDEAAETPKAKKAKTSPAPAAKRGKTETSAKKSGASTSKSKTTTKPRTKLKDDSKVDGKAKDETLKSIAKSEEDKGGKNKDSKSGNKDKTPKAVGKSKANDVDASKGSTKPQQETPKGATKSKGKSPKSGSKSNNSSSKVKAAPQAEDEEEDMESSPETPKVPETSKGKSQNTSKSKSAKKRKRGAKG